LSFVKLSWGAITDKINWQNFA